MKQTVATNSNPCCGYVTTTATDFREPDAIPKAGDIAVCLKCGTTLIYVDGPKNIMRLATPKDISELNPLDVEELGRVREMVLNGTARKEIRKLRK